MRNSVIRLILFVLFDLLFALIAWRKFGFLISSVVVFLLFSLQRYIFIKLKLDCRNSVGLLIEAAIGFILSALMIFTVFLIFKI